MEEDHKYIRESNSHYFVEILVNRITLVSISTIPCIYIARYAWLKEATDEMMMRRRREDLLGRIKKN